MQGTVPELTRRADGKVWELSVSQEEARRWQEKATVANLRHEENRIVLRIVSDDRPGDNAIPCEAALEDIYLYYFQTEEGDR